MAVEKVAVTADDNIKLLVAAIKHLDGKVSYRVQCLTWNQS